MQVLERIRARAAAAARHIVLPEGEDLRTLQAAAMCATDRIARITLLGREEIIRDLAVANGVPLTSLSIVDHTRSVDAE